MTAKTTGGRRGEDGQTATWSKRDSTTKMGKDREAGVDEEEQEEMTRTTPL
jgi:hypothetical protein